MLSFSVPQIRERQLSVAFKEGGEHLALELPWILACDLPRDTQVTTAAELPDVAATPVADRLPLPMLTILLKPGP